MFRSATSRVPGPSLEAAGIPLFLWSCAVFWCLGGVVLLQGRGFDIFKAVHTTNFPALDVFFVRVTQLGEFIFIGTVLLLLWLFRYRNWPFFILIVLTQLVPFLLNQGLKFLFLEPRPHAVYGGEAWFRQIEGVMMHNNLSFPSGHTAGAFAFFTLLSLLLSKKRKAWALIYFLGALLVGFSRMYLGQHFFADIYAASILGTSCTLFFYLVWKKYFPARTPVPKGF